MSVISVRDSLDPWGELPPVPRYETLENRIPAGTGREAFHAIARTLEDLGRAVQLGHHRSLVEELNSKLASLGPESLMNMAIVALEDVELCTALSVYMTCLEQTYHWPRELDGHLTTPTTFNEYKMVIQVFHEPELLAKLSDECILGSTLFLQPEQYQKKLPLGPAQMTLAALAMAREMYSAATAAQKAGNWPLPRTQQDLVNLLNRTARGDIWDQGGYASYGCHKEMGRLHEMIRTNGSQRRCQEIFEDAGGVVRLQRMPALLTQLDINPASLSSLVMCEALADLQVAVALVREELFGMVIDEVIWGHTFAKWSKACSVSDIGSSGSDCPLFWMFDGFIGRAEPEAQAILPDSLASRSRFFPPDVTALVKALASAPGIRQHTAKKDGARYAVVQAWKALQQMLHDLYDIHRKKAMRIILALRAGRGKTSSNVQKAGSPEAHLSNTLYQALNVRFGSDVRDLNIDAYAWSSPLLFGANECIEAVRTRFVFSTPLAISPGDVVCVSVPLQLPEGNGEGVQWHERTYSITGIDTLQLAGNPKPMDGPVQLSGSIEVCVRNQGKGSISEYICNKHTGFPVRLRIKSAPHFRIQGNANPQDESVFVAQGGAVGVFLAWLARQNKDSLVGRYRLVIGVRNYSMLAYSSLILHLATTLGPKKLRIIVALSRPDPNDVKTLLAGGIKPYNGRAMGYLSLCSLSFQEKITWYICGSAEFGLDVARCINEKPKKQGQAQKPDMHRFGTRLQPILTSEIPDVRLHVAGSSSTADDHNNAGAEVPPPIISRTELALHNQPGNRWIALGSRVVDITILPTFHPGGEKVLAHCGGRQAQGMLDTVHRDSHMVESMVRRMVIGHLAEPNSAQSEWEEIIDGLVEVQNDLETQTRFEQTPTGCPKQLERAPSAEIIRGSLQNLILGWSEKVLVRGLGASLLDENTVALMQSVLDKVNIHLNGIQAKAYTEHFADVERCAAVLRYVYESHYVAANKIHYIIDDIKREIYEYIDILNISPERSLLSNGTTDIMNAIQDIMVEDAAAY